MLTYLPQNPVGGGKKIEFSGTDNPRNMPQPEDELISDLDGDGSFDSSECVELLKEADVVVTNPPFSKMKEFLQLMIDEKKQFLIIAHQTSFQKIQLFPYFRDGLVWTGYDNKTTEFVVPECNNDESTYRNKKIGKKCKRIQVAWLTNIPIDKTQIPIDLCCPYNKRDYPKFLTYDVIEVGSIAEIPKDYFKPMAVPVSYPIHHCEHQFEVIGLLVNGCIDEEINGVAYIPISKELLSVMEANARDERNWTKKARIFNPKNAILHEATANSPGRIVIKRKHGDARDDSSQNGNAMAAKLKLNSH